MSQDVGRTVKVHTTFICTLPTRCHPVIWGNYCLCKPIFASVSALASQSVDLVIVAVKYICKVACDCFGSNSIFMVDVPVITILFCQYLFPKTA